MAKKVTLIVLGIVVMLCGIGSVTVGAIMAAVVGSDNSLKTPEERLTSDTAALVSSAAQINLNGMGSSNRAFSGISIAARSTGKPIFLGIAPTSAVDQYLSNATFDEVTNVKAQPFHLDTTRHGTTLGPITPPPNDQTFWTAKASGQTPTLNWTVAEGDFRIVVMNADGSPGVDTQAIIGIQVVGLYSFGIGGVVCGVVIGLIGLALLIWGIRTKPRPPSQVYAAYPGGGAGYPGYGYPAASYPPAGPEQPGPVQPGAPPVGAEPQPPTEPGYPPANWPQPDYPQPSRPLPEPPAQPPAGDENRPY